MARCDSGYFCETCGLYVESVIESELYLRYVMGEIPTEGLLTLPDRHIRCNAALAQYIVHEDFPPIVEDRPEHDKRRLDPAWVRDREDLVTRAWVRLRSLPASGLDVRDYPLPDVKPPDAAAFFAAPAEALPAKTPDPEGRIFF
ncbi:MAG: hypothetical protein HY720_04925 [Planctomycetes bacterium]|nr:hypothetical protein [Planctomycetota bacterium]